MLAAGSLSARIRLGIFREVLNHDATNALLREAVLSGLENQEVPFLAELMRATDRSGYRPGWDALLNALAAAIVRSQSVSDRLLLLQWVADEPSGWRRTALTAGLALGLRQGKPIALAQRPNIATQLPDEKHSLPHNPPLPH